MTTVTYDLGWIRRLFIILAFVTVLAIGLWIHYATQIHVVEVTPQTVTTTFSS